jgi:hypothetical protein
MKKINVIKIKFVTLAFCQTSRYSALRRGISSVGRALRLHRRCRQFESVIPHQPPPFGLRLARQPESNFHFSD